MKKSSHADVSRSQLVFCLTSSSSFWPLFFSILLHFWKYSVKCLSAQIKISRCQSCASFPLLSICLSVCLLSLCPSLSSYVSSGSRLGEGRGGDLINPFAAGHLQAQTWKGSFFFSPGMSARKAQDRVMNVCSVWRMAMQGITMEAKGGRGG